MTARSIGLYKRNLQHHGLLTATTFSDAFHHLLPNATNFTAKSSRKIPIRYGMHFSAILSNYNDTAAYNCRRFIPITTFLVNIWNSLPINSVVDVDTV